MQRGHGAVEGTWHHRGDRGLDRQQRAVEETWGHKGYRVLQQGTEGRRGDRWLLRNQGSQRGQKAIEGAEGSIGDQTNSRRGGRGPQREKGPYGGAEGGKENRCLKRGQRTIEMKEGHNRRGAEAIEGTECRGGDIELQRGQRAVEERFFQGIQSENAYGNNRFAFIS